ncbi:anthocyanidin 3-O-glucosyltransferase 2-like [Chenopodium quinoa]|uniref:Glycosyltransferase n=1 Tax=Chenopodium quinoa TaxID=63459 RepID=A0A803KW28_CHEQI|nr:anthocyanidin 3-O-glucosyltransferase 2-like [Chenopodium quinoa]
MELVFVPTPGMGHLLSAVELAKRILDRDHRISILILIFNIPMTSHMLNSFIESQSRDNHYPTRLTFCSLPPLSNPPDSTSPNFFITLISLHKPLVQTAVEDKVKAGSLAGFVLDMFCTTMIEVADHFMVPSYIFFASGASMLNIVFHFLMLEDDQGIDVAAKLDDPDIEFDAPGFVNRVPGKVVPEGIVSKEIGSFRFLDQSREFKKSKGIIVNTFTELETFGLQPLFDQVSKHGMLEIYPVGPILELDTKDRGGHRGDDGESIIRWLDDQPLSSVVFLCFGSMGCFDEDQVMEIANGLEKSGHRFLWSLRKPPPKDKLEMPSEHDTFENVLPEGFLDRVAERGKIIGWAPQVSILGHKAVGGFVSHCGWNSTLESLWFGVPMATWPMYAEQQLNAFELVKELGLAVEIRIDYRSDWKTRKGNYTVTAEEIENGVKKLMSLDEETKNKVREMSDKSRSALEDGGSSHKRLGQFIEDVLSNVA